MQFTCIWTGTKIQAQIHTHSTHTHTHSGIAIYTHWCTYEGIHIYKYVGEGLFDYIYVTATLLKIYETFLKKIITGERNS